MLVSSAGGYLFERQKAFDAPSPYGDHTIRTFPTAVSFDALAFAHDHYDHTFINLDPQVALPLRHLEDLTAAGRIGQLAPSVVSFMGYQPDSARVVDETIPQIVSIAKDQNVQAALLAPV
jgi:D-proline reductase (dithiol) PrdB